MFGRLFKGFAAFRRDRRGNVAMLWGLMGAGLIGLIGLTVDFTRAQAIHTQLQNAADGAALAAARAPANLSLADRTTAAQAFFDAEAGDYGTAAGATFALAPVGTQGYRVDAGIYMKGSLSRLISKEDWHIGVQSQAVRGGVNLEVALVLDTTGSMSGSKLPTLQTAATELVNTIVQDEQTPFYSRLALVSYSVGVNLGADAAAARGAIPPGRNISAVTWGTGTARAITGATQARPVVITANSHGFTNGQIVGITGVRGMTNLNNNYYSVQNVTGNTFQLYTPNGQTRIDGRNWSAWQSGGTQRVQRCQTTACEAVVSSTAHGFATNARVFLTNVASTVNNRTGSGNGTTWTAIKINDDSFALSGTNGMNVGVLGAGGRAFCTTYGCEYHRFINADGGVNVFQVSSCVTERTGAEAYTDAAPGTALVSLNYPSTASNGACPSNTVLPLTSNRSTINSRIAGLTRAGYTAGHIGAAWGWYTISPNFNSLWSGVSLPAAAYGAPETLKVMVLMTDGAFNTSYYNGVIAQDTSGAGNDVDHINQNATNGDPLEQAEAICAAMKARGIIIYTVAFDMAGESDESKAMMANCATSEAHAKTADSTAELVTAFQQIAQSISQLRISR
jgi:Flp pilus assembly protein TadG